MYIDIKLYVTRSKIILMTRVITRAWEQVGSIIIIELNIF
jgi:hypothetical protein